MAWARPVRNLMAALAAASLAYGSTACAQTSDGDWPMAAKNYQNTRYSELAEINTSNVSR